MSCKLQVLGAGLALGFSSIAAGFVPAVPTITIAAEDDSPAAAKVIFPPARPAGATETLPGPIRFGSATSGPVAEKETPATTEATRGPSDESAPPKPVIAPLAAVVTGEVSAAPTVPDAAPAPAPVAVSFVAPSYDVADSGAPASEVRATQPRTYKPPLWVREMLAACLVLEAASQGEFGMRAVMAVIRNRAGAQPKAYARTVLEPKQFSALNKVTEGRETLAAAVRRAKRDRVWRTAVAIVEDALDDSWHDPTGGATHYTRSAEHTQWTRRLAKTTTIGAHSFYR